MPKSGVITQKKHFIELASAVKLLQLLEDKSPQPLYQNFD